MRISLSFLFSPLVRQRVELVREWSLTCLSERERDEKESLAFFVFFMQFFVFPSFFFFQKRKTLVSIFTTTSPSRRALPSLLLLPLLPSRWPAAS